ncbi:MULTISPECIES: ParB/RepB/Spo0J family partition protein [unclassified Variovorax]|uniref:ParB/RepB/Spo0J family partition protein n=1 Tax=unclassified Variovorax TaxID=663243 RepID=UPI000A06E2B0|nr:MULTISPECIES: ParB/RepB/Spo0J family partition protein [unclassified Variovorax]PNG50008.1 hypothetical protein CHC06_05589 [Variovorax sp. B2]PNG50880.1 hypothetical protein CHC07_05494 [Variovorax sp. B4]VTV17031.1 hypothetical protein WDL1P1_00002 [Variovorax sp. WDL1]
MATKGREQLSAISDAVLSGPTSPAMVRQRPLPAPTQLMNLTGGHLESKAEIERLKKEQGKALVIRLDLCDDGPFHSSPLDPVRVANLKANLKENPQTTPAQLRPAAAGRFQILAGRHRKAALLELGREEWLVTIREASDDEAERVTFYDNLLAPQLTDYAKYLGLAQRKASRSFTVRELETESGLSKSQVARLLSFERLPAAARQLVASKPSVIGANVVELLAALAKDHGDRVVQAVELVVEGKLKASKAPAWVTAPPKEKNAERRRQPSTDLAVDGTRYVRIRRRDGLLSMAFTSAQEADELERIITELIKDRIAKLKSLS